MQSTKFLLGFVLASPMLAQLQSRPPVLQLSLKQAVQIALAPEGSTRVKLAEEAVKQAERRAGQARAGAVRLSRLPAPVSRVRFDGFVLARKTGNAAWVRRAAAMEPMATPPRSPTSTTIVR